MAFFVLAQLCAIGFKIVLNQKMRVFIIVARAENRNLHSLVLLNQILWYIFAFKGDALFSPKPIKPHILEKLEKCILVLHFTFILRIKFPSIHFWNIFAKFSNIFDCLISSREINGFNETRLKISEMTQSIRKWQILFVGLLAL